MVVPGGQVFKPTKCARRIENDERDVAAGNLIPLLIGTDIVGSHVDIEVQEAEKTEIQTFVLQRTNCLLTVTTLFRLITRDSRYTYRLLQGACWQWHTIHLWRRLKFSRTKCGPDGSICSSFKQNHSVPTSTPFYSA